MPVWGVGLCLHTWQCVYAYVFVCFYVCFSLFVFVYISECVHVCMFPFQTCTQHPCTQTSTAARRTAATAPQIFRIVTLCCPLSSPLPLSFFLLSPLLFNPHMQRDKQSSGERGLGPFSKDTFETAQHVTEGYPLPCQVTPAVCGQVYLTGRHINTHTFSIHADTHAHAVHTKTQT